ncbi:EamA-like transporter family-domain-containing protein [Kickxella alabastrina]|uniref:EamA-like transporter family-domain-containing protein n=1 Tax=Kickxella alabastrina TaxID=61397 RepID=UPI00222095D7|nr:EamA-like transporter family-domain-containing protein [Kickxella alabastrina]KAI7822744.1 EamA-like transporter family-domain-containing protein [Kickxella alabastrina]
MASELKRLLLPSPALTYNATALADTASMTIFNKDINALRTHADRRKGLTLAALSAIAFAIMTLLVRVLSDQGFTPLQIMFWRSIVQTAAALLACKLMGVPLRVGSDHGWDKFRWVLMRAICGCLGHLLYYAALANMPMGIATVLFFTNPLFTAVFANWLLGEDFSRRHRMLSLVCLFGIVLVVVPGSPLALLLGGGISIWSLSALLGAVSAALAYVSIRLAGRGVHPMVHVAYFGFVGALGGLLLSWVSGEAWCMPQASVAGWAAVAGVGVMAFLAQYLMNWGLQLTNAGPVVMMRNTDIVLSFVFDVVLYQTVPAVSSICGAVVITLCVIAMSL